MSSPDLIVVGAGPSGTIIATECAATGLSVELWSKEHPSPWPNNYGIWLHDIEGDPVWMDAIKQRWGAPSIHFMNAPPFHPELTYVNLDNQVLRQGLLSQFVASGGKLVTRQVKTTTVSEDFVALTDTEGHQTQTKLVIDATGHRPVLAVRPPSDKVAYQTAWGALMRIKPTEHSGQMRLMDFRLAEETRSAKKTPSFLYALPMEEDVVFFEETSLAARPMVSVELLKARLFRRLAKEGVEVLEVLEEERCVIPMGDELPVHTPGVVAWGGAASMVHPATGYQLNRAKLWSKDVARVLATAIGLGPEAAARAVQGSIWTPQRQKLRALYMYGLEAMMKFEADELSGFFAAFFAQPEALWKPYYLGEGLTPAQMARSMWSTFRHVPSQKMRWTLMSGVFGRDRALLTKGLFGSGEHRDAT